MHQTLLWRNGGHCHVSRLVPENCQDREMLGCVLAYELALLEERGLFNGQTVLGYGDWNESGVTWVELATLSHRSVDVTFIPVFLVICHQWNGSGENCWMRAHVGLGNEAGRCPGLDQVLEDSSEAGGIIKYQSIDFDVPAIGEPSDTPSQEEQRQSEEASQSTQVSEPPPSSSKKPFDF